MYQVPTATDAPTSSPPQSLPPSVINPGNRNGSIVYHLETTTTGSQGQHHFRNCKMGNQVQIQSDSYDPMKVGYLGWGGVAMTSEPLYNWDYHSGDYSWFLGNPMKDDKSLHGGLGGCWDGFSTEQALLMECIWRPSFWGLNEINDNKVMAKNIQSICISLSLSWLSRSFKYSNVWIIKGSCISSSQQMT